MKIFVVGSLNTDLVIETDRFPQAGETVYGKNFMANSGGKGANQAFAAAKLGGDVYMCGVVGDDDFGKAHLENLSGVGVNVKHIRKTKTSPTGTAVIVVNEGNNRIIIDGGANTELCKDDIDAFLKEAESGDILLTQLENPIDIIGYALKSAREKGMVTVLNPAPANTVIIPYLKYADIVTPNETELELLGGKKELFGAGVSEIITTLGKNGFEIDDGKTSKRYPCVQVKAVDTTAAGDTLCGGLVLGLSEGKTLEESCIFGSRAASIACSRYGASKSVPTREEVENFKK